MEAIISYIGQHGLPVFIIACCIIFVIGILKICKVFSKIKSANTKKLLYYITDIALAFGGSAIYFAAFKLNWSGYVVFSTAQLSATTTLYAIYENVGIRKFVRWVGTILLNMLKVTNVAKKLGINDAIELLQKTIDEKTQEAIVEQEVTVEEVQNNEQSIIEPAQPTVVEADKTAVY